jgi:hypothetical protein
MIYIVPFSLLVQTAVQAVHVSHLNVHFSCYISLVQHIMLTLCLEKFS